MQTFQKQINGRVNEIVGNLVKELDVKKKRGQERRKLAQDYSLMMFGEEDISIDIRAKLSVNAQQIEDKYADKDKIYEEINTQTDLIKQEICSQPFTL